MKTVIAAFSVVTNIVVMATAAQADVAYEFPIGKGAIYTTPTFDAVEGNLFEVGGTDIRVTRLAYEYQRDNQQSNPTAIFNATTGDIIVQANISGLDSLENGYLWQDIAPTILQAGERYYIGSLHQSGTGSEYYWNSRVASSTSLISDIGTYFKASSTIEGGNWQFSGGTSQYGGTHVRHYVGNFEAEAVPEPMTLALVPLAAIALKKRKK